MFSVERTQYVFCCRYSVLNLFSFSVVGTQCFLFSVVGLNLFLFSVERTQYVFC